ncbi:hypothetical protein HDU90_005318 [Geranomyces variabilis]|nr:hypothetical protein HDU90_005318 [Geranomyces variabilis]
MADINWIDRILSTVAALQPAAAEQPPAPEDALTSVLEDPKVSPTATLTPDLANFNTLPEVIPAANLISPVDDVNFMSFENAALPLDVAQAGAPVAPVPSDLDLLGVEGAPILDVLPAVDSPITDVFDDSVLFAVDTRPSVDNIAADYHDAELYNDLFPIQLDAPIQLTTQPLAAEEVDAAAGDVEDISDEDGEIQEIKKDHTESAVASSGLDASVALEVSLDDVVVPETMVIVPIESAPVKVEHTVKDEAAASDEDDAGKNSDFAFSDSSDDDDDESEDEAPKLTTAQREKLLQSLDAHPEDPSDAPASTLRTKNEVATLPPVNPVTEPIPHDAPILAVGKIQSVVGELLIIQTPPDVDADRALDADTVLVSAERKPIGKIFETFGPVTRPFYSVRFNNAEEIAALNLPVGSEVYVPRAPGLEKVVFTRALKALKGSDASNINDEECDDEELEFSDDEAEAEHKRQLKLARKRKRAGDEEGGSAATASLPLPPIPDEIADSAEYQLNGRPAYGAGGATRGAGRGAARGSRGRGGADRGGGGGGRGGGGGSFNGPQYIPGSSSRGGPVVRGRGRGGRGASGAGGGGTWSGNQAGSYHQHSNRGEYQSGGNMTQHHHQQPQQQYGQQQQQPYTSHQQPFYGDQQSFAAPYQQAGFVPQQQAAFPAAQLAMAALLLQQQQQQQQHQQQQPAANGGGVAPAPPTFDLASMMGLMQGVMQNQAAFQQQNPHQQPQQHQQHWQQSQRHHHNQQNQQFGGMPQMQPQPPPQGLGLPPRPPQGPPPSALRQQLQQQYQQQQQQPPQQ